MVSFYAYGNITFNTLISFDSSTSGSNPHCKLVQDSVGNIYGTTFLGSSNHYGTIFKINLDGNLTTLMSFDFTNGANPWSGLVSGNDGYFYGATQEGGTNLGGFGTLFKVSTNGTFTSLVSFAGTNGIIPNGLVQGNDGNFYGTTESGGTDTNNPLYGQGTVFEMNPNGTLTTLAFFNSTNGSYPEAGLVQGIDGNFYGTTTFGGTYNYGTIFQVTTNGSLTTLFSFDLTNGYQPKCTLANGVDGGLYGVTPNGGANNQGAIFRITTNGNFTLLYSFSSRFQGTNADGAQPTAGLTLATDGNFYGTTSTDAPHGVGTIFKITPSGMLTTLYSFGTVTNSHFNPIDGKNPNDLFQGRDGNFYGTAFNGGTNNNIANSGDGTVFRFSVPLPPVFQNITQTNGMFSLTWSTVASQIYQLQYTTNLNSTNWINLGNTNVATNAIMSEIDSVGLNSQRFYRVVVP
jgi:uncharacterized repeat protein (TIGR03803 family)